MKAPKHIPPRVSPAGQPQGIRPLSANAAQPTPAPATQWPARFGAAQSKTVNPFSRTAPSSIAPPPTKFPGTSQQPALHHSRADGKPHPPTDKSAVTTAARVVWASLAPYPAGLGSRTKRRTDPAPPMQTKTAAAAQGTVQKASTGPRYVAPGSRNSGVGSFGGGRGGGPATGGSGRGLGRGGSSSTDAKSSAGGNKPRWASRSGTSSGGETKDAPKTTRAESWVREYSLAELQRCELSKLAIIGTDGSRESDIESYLKSHRIANCLAADIELNAQRGQGTRGWLQSKNDAWMKKCITNRCGFLLVGERHRKLMVDGMAKGDVAAHISISTNYKENGTGAEMIALLGAGYTWNGSDTLIPAPPRAGPGSSAPALPIPATPTPTAETTTTTTTPP